MFKLTLICAGLVLTVAMAAHAKPTYIQRSSQRSLASTINKRLMAFGPNLPRNLLTHARWLVSKPGRGGQSARVSNTVANLEKSVKGAGTSKSGTLQVHSERIVSTRSHTSSKGWRTFRKDVVHKLDNGDLVGSTLLNRVNLKTGRIAKRVSYDEPHFWEAVKGGQKRQIHRREFLSRLSMSWE
jgi:hypothetical protein